MEMCFANFYNKWKEKTTGNIKFLILTESPNKVETYFYNDSKDYILGNFDISVFYACGINFDPLNHKKSLTEFVEKGFFLLDLVNRPLSGNKGDKEIKDFLNNSKNLHDLITEINSLNPEKIILTSRKDLDLFYREKLILFNDKIINKNSIPIPFGIRKNEPPNQKVFIHDVKQLIENHN